MKAPNRSSNPETRFPVLTSIRGCLLYLASGESAGIPTHNTSKRFAGLAAGLAAVLVSGLAVVPRAGASLLVEETFDTYTVGASLSGASGGTGWTANWAITKPGTETITSGNVNGLGSGNRLGQSQSSTTPQASRTFTTIDNSANRTVWFAFWIQSNQVKGTTTVNLSGLGGTMFSIIASTGGTATPYYQFYGTTIVGTTVTGTTAAQLFVVKMDITTSGTTALTCFVNPNLRNDWTTWTVASTSSQTSTGITGFVFRSNNNTGALVTYVDAIRLATTWQEATAGTVGPWDGGNTTDGSWSRGGYGGNWSGGAQPYSASTSSLVFGANANSMVSSNDIADPFELNTVTFSNTMTLSGGALKFSGSTPTLAVSNAAAVVTISNNLQLVQSQTWLQGSGTGIVAGVVSSVTAGTGLTMSGSGLWQLANANTYSGATTISNGTLALGASGTINSSSGVRILPGACFDVKAASFTLASGQTLSGSGTVNGALSAASGSTTAPGAGIGTLTNDLSGAKTANFASGAGFAFDLGAPGTSDAVAFTGLTASTTSVTFNGNTINFNNAGGLAVGNYTLFTFDANSAYTGTLTIGTGLEAFTPTFIYNANSIQLQLSSGSAPLSTVTVTKTQDSAKEGLTNGLFTVMRDTVATNTSVTVFYTMGGTATAGTDYSSLSGSVTMPAGSTNATVTVSPIWNTGWSNTTVILTLSADATYTVGTPSNATVNITGATEPVVTIVNTTDGSHVGPSNGLFTVSRPCCEGATNLALTVNYAVSGTAVAGSGFPADFTALPGSVTFAVGATSTNITLPVLQSTNYAQGTKTVIVTLSANSLYAVGTPGSATNNIAPPPPPVVSIVKTTDGSHVGPTNGLFTVSRSTTNGINYALAVYYTVDAASTAVVGTDYTALSGLVTIPASATTATITVPMLVSTNWTQGTTSLILNLSANAAYAVGTPGSATNSIAPGVEPTVTIVNTTDGSHVGPSNGLFTVTRSTSNGTNYALAVNYTVDAASTATAGSDYTALPGSVTIPAGATSATILVPVLVNNDWSEGTTMLILDLSANAGYTVGEPGSATNNIATGVEPTVTIAKAADASETGPANGSFTVTRSTANGINYALPVSYTVDASSTATPGVNYTPLTGSLTIASNATTASINVQVLETYSFDGRTNTVVLDLSANPAYTVGTPGSASVNITNLASAPAVGQTNLFTALYTFSNTVVGTVTDPTPPPYVPGVQCGSFSMVGIGADGLAGAFYADSWNPQNNTGGAQLTNQYFQVTLAPMKGGGVGAAMTLTNITFDLARQTSGGNGPTNWAVRSSLDNYAANLATFTSTNGNLPVVGGTTVTIAPGVAQASFQSGASLALDSSFANLTSNLTFRIYGWNAGQNKDGGIDNFQVSGWWAVAPLPVITIDTTNQTACAGSPVTWSVAVAGDNVTYQWQRRGTNLVEGVGNFTGTTTSTLINSGVTAADAVAATNGYACLITTNGTFGINITSTKAALTVNPLPTVTVSSPTVCAETLPATITATAANGTAPYNYVWTVPAGVADPGNVASFNATVAGLYSVAVSDSKGCASASGSGTLTVKPTPATPTAGNNSPVYGAPLQLTASTVSGASYSWTGPNSFTASVQNPTVSTSATPALAGAYYVIAHINGCSSAAGSTTVVVNQASTTNRVITSPNPSLPGADVTITAAPGAVPPGSGTPTGTVLFKTNGVPLCGSVALDSNGVATLITNSLPHGSTTVTAEYAGDTNFQGSTNSVVQVANTPPLATNSTAGTLANKALILSVAKLLLNASDPDGDSLSISSAGPTSTNGPTGNIALDTGAGTLAYTPATNYVGTDSFTYTVSDSLGGTTTATVYVTVSSNNGGSPNIAVPPTYTDGTFRVTFAGIPNYEYTIEYAESPTGPWSYLKKATAGSDGLFEVVDEPLPETPARYYRTVYP